MIDASTTTLLSLAIDAATMRQQALAQNIANVNTPGYQRITVSFEDRIGALMDSQGMVHAPVGAELNTFRPFFQIADTGSADNKVSLDTEIAQLSENTLHHQVLLKALSKHFALIQLAVNEGRR